MRRTAIPVLALSLMAAACERSPQRGSGVELVPLGGEVRVLHDGEWASVTGTMELVRGDQVRAGEDGHARIDLRGGRSVELAPEARIGLVDPGEPEVMQGSVLATSGAGLSLGLEDARVTGEDAVFRVDRGIAQRVAVYEGEAMVPGSGWEAPVEAFQQLSLVGGTVVRAPGPLQVDTEDPWDRRLLEDEIDVGSALGRQETGLSSQLRGKRVRPAVLDTLSGSVPGRTLAALLEEAPPAEVVVAAIIASVVADGVPSVVLREILELRDRGASWIVVVGRWGVGRSVLDRLGGFVTAIARALGLAAARPRGSSVGAGGGPPSGALSSGGTSTRGTGTKPRKKPPKNKTDPGPAEPPRSAEPPSGGGGSSPSPVSEPPKCSDPVSCAIEEVVGEDPLGGLT